MTIRALIIDDEDDNLELMAQMLEDNDIEAIECNNGPEAIEIARQEHPDVIILDIHMPEMDGFEVCKILKEDDDTRHIPIIFLTATYSSEKNIVKGLELGAYDYVTKPFRERELVARIHVMAKIKQTEDTVREESYTDPLTGLYNRRFLEKRFSEELSRARRSSVALGCLMLDIDHFKSINDMYGHEAGDKVLKTIATTVEKNIREYDTFARYGGEEFVLLLPSTDYKNSELVAEKVRTTVEATNIPYQDTIITATVSIGVFCGTDSDSNLTVDDFIRRADEALYKAKGSGRNRVISYQNIF